MRVLNSSGVLDETTEEGRIFQTGIVLGKNEFLRSYSYIFACWAADLMLSLQKAIEVFAFLEVLFKCLF